MKIIILLISLSIGLSSCTHSNNNKMYVSKNDRIDPYEKYLRVLLNLALTDSTYKCCFIDTTVFINIRDKETAMKAIEPILFEGYGKESIIEQKPYRVTYLDKYWIIEGIQKEPQIGGTFQLILDSRNGEIIYLMRGK